MDLPMKDRMNMPTEERRKQQIEYRKHAQEKVDRLWKNQGYRVTHIMAKVVKAKDSDSGMIIVPAEWIDEYVSIEV